MEEENKEEETRGPQDSGSDYDASKIQKLEGLLCCGIWWLRMLVGQYTHHMLRDNFKVAPFKELDGR